MRKSGSHGLLTRSTSNWRGDVSRELIDPKWTSPSLKPMISLVQLLTDDAKRRPPLAVEAEASPDGTAADLGGLCVQTLDGHVVRLWGMSRDSTVEELHYAVEARFGVSVENQRLYVADSSVKLKATSIKRLELLSDPKRRLEEYGLFKESGDDRIHLHNRDYEEIRRQLEVATRVVDSILDQHYESFNESVLAVERMGASYDKLATLATDARDLVDSCRDALNTAPPDEAKSLWTRKLEADAALTLLAKLKAKALGNDPRSQSTMFPPQGLPPRRTAR